MQKFHFSYTTTKVTELPIQIQTLIAAAQEATYMSYAPYSHFRVGAALLLDNGKIFTGANHENASFPAGICAERALLGTLDMAAPEKVTAIAVSYTSNGDHATPLSPCGICRQSILEVQLHQASPIAVYMCSPAGHVIIVEDATYLLPFHFSRKNLDMSEDKA
ncbi:MAG: cytidine deaminase [Bacteroidota bacterium]